MRTFGATSYAQLRGAADFQHAIVLAKLMRLDVHNNGMRKC